MTTLEFAPLSATGTLSLKSPFSFQETLSRLSSALVSHGIKVFATIDQQAEAKAAGLSMLPMTLILFGNPKAGTPLMMARPVSGLDLPLKALVWASGDGEIFVTLNTASYIITRHDLPEALLGNLAPAEKLISATLTA